MTAFRVPSKLGKISPGRAQDWITSALNPMIEGVRRETRLLEAVRWDWQPGARRLEYISPCAGYVSEIFRDNLEDFLEKFPAVAARLEEHDRLVAELEHALAAAFDAVKERMTPEMKATVLGLFQQEDRLQYLDYFVASVVSGNADERPSSLIAKPFNSNAELRRDLLRLLGTIPDGRRIADELRTLDVGLVRDLIRLRSDIADRFGARIVPVLRAG